MPNQSPFFLANTGLERLHKPADVVCRAPFVGSSVLVNISLTEADGLLPLAVELTQNELRVSREDQQPYDIKDAHWLKRQQENSWERVLDEPVQNVTMYRQRTSDLWLPDSSLLKIIRRRTAFQFFVNQVISGVARKQFTDTLAGHL